MSWVKTSISPIGFGFAIVQFFECLQQMPGIQPPPFQLLRSIWVYHSFLALFWPLSFQLAVSVHEPIPAPQVAATLAAALVAYDARDSAGQRLLDGTMLNAVLVLMLVTSILGQLLAERFPARMLAPGAQARAVPPDAPDSGIQSGCGHN